MPTVLGIESQNIILHRHDVADALVRVITSSAHVEAGHKPMIARTSQ